MISSPRRTAAALLLPGVVALATACVPVPAHEAKPSPVPTRESTPVLPVPASSAPASEAPDDVGDVDAEDVDYVAALLEREAFFGEQQQPLDSAILTAATDAQRQFIAEQRAYTESRGGEWSAEAETIALAVSLDACESAILNGHRFAAENFRAHLVTSPLFHDLAGDDPQRQQGLTQIMLTGMSFLCPDDAPQWDEASREVLGP